MDQLFWIVMSMMNHDVFCYRAAVNLCHENGYVRIWRLDSLGCEKWRHDQQEMVFNMNTPNC